MPKNIHVFLGIHDFPPDKVDVIPGEGGGEVLGARPGSEEVVSMLLAGSFDAEVVNNNGNKHEAADTGPKTWGVGDGAQQQGRRRAVSHLHPSCPASGRPPTPFLILTRPASWCCSMMHSGMAQVGIFMMCSQCSIGVLRQKLETLKEWNLAPGVERVKLMKRLAVVMSAVGALAFLAWQIRFLLAADGEAPGTTLFGVGGFFFDNDAEEASDLATTCRKVSVSNEAHCGGVNDVGASLALGKATGLICTTTIDPPSLHNH